jgi:hypothetical protein
MIRCYFCRTAVDDVETAIQLDWIPSFYDGDREVSEPVCPRCASARLQLGNDGELELAEHTRYADEAESAQRGNAWPQAAALWRRAAEACANAEQKARYLANERWCDDMPGISSPE